MSVFEKRNKTKIHTRQLSAEIYMVDEDHLMIEGVLKDDRIKESRRSTGEIIPGGILHHMVIRLFVSLPSLVIEDLEVEINASPYSVCVETRDVMNGMKGVSISSGFTKKVRSLAGGSRGCAHLVSLLLVMGQAAFQGFWTHASTKTNGNDMFTEERLRFLEGTCWAWRKGGGLQRELLKKTQQ